MIILTRNGLMLSISEGMIPAQGSSDVPVQYINDTDEYKDYIVTPIAGWTQANGLSKSSICEYADGIIKIPAGAFLQSGTISIAIQMTDPSNSSHIEATYPAVANVQKAPNASIKLPAEPIWHKFITDYMNQYFDSEFDDRIQFWINENQVTFDEWFEQIVGKLGSDPAGELQLQINDIVHGPTKVNKAANADSSTNAIKLNNQEASFYATKASVDSERAERIQTVNIEKNERKQEIEVERQRINQLSKLSEGSTTGDAELIDMRVGYDGTLYDTAGEAVRNQVSEIHENAPMFKGAITIDKPLNTFVNSGYYRIVENHPDSPMGVTSSSIMNVVSYDVAVIQFLYTINNGVYRRWVFKNGDIASDWEKYADDKLTFAKRGHLSNDINLKDVSEMGVFTWGTDEHIEDSPFSGNSCVMLNIPYVNNTSNDLNAKIQCVIDTLRPSRYAIRYIYNTKEGISYNSEWYMNAGADTVYYALGDSITAGSYSIEDGSAVVAKNATWSYPNQIARKYGCRCINLGEPGAPIMNLGNLVNKIGLDASLVTITGGANDYYLGNAQLGTPNDEDTNTICGSLKNTIKSIAQKVPKARIVLISPFIIKYGDATIETKWSREYRYNTFTYDELNQAFKDIANLLNIEFIDGTTNGPTNIYNLESVQYDGVHPSIEYYGTIANWLGSKLF